MAKTETIIIRIEPKLKRLIQKKADEERREFSNMVRIILYDSVGEKGK